MKLFSELRRRNVFKVASVYLVTSWIILQVIAVVSPALHLPVVFSTVVTVLLVTGFPLVCLFAWAFELTPEGIRYTKHVTGIESRRTDSGNKINYALAVSLIVALAFIIYEKFYADTTSGTQDLSIAVLPFEDMSPDKTQEYFGDGIAEEILNSLARLDALTVISRTSSFNFKNNDADIREIGEALNVNFVLEGSVRKDKNQLRITAQLIDVESGSHIWSETYDRQLDSIFAVQDELTYAITEALKLNLLPEDIRPEIGMTSNPKAYELFVQGRELAYQRDPETLPKAAKLLQQAIEIDPAFYLAKAQLYSTYMLGNSYGGFSIESINRNTERLFWSLLEGPNFPLKFLVLGEHANQRGATDVADALYEKAYRAAPNDPLIQNVYPLTIDEPETAIAVREQIKITNPNNRINYYNLASLYLSEHRYKEVEALIPVIENKFNDSWAAAFYQISIPFIYEQNLSASIALIEKRLQANGNDAPMLLWGAKLYLVEPNIDKSINYFKQAVALSPDLIAQSYDYLVMIEQLKHNDAMTHPQIEQLNDINIPSSVLQDVAVIFELLNGNVSLFEKIHDRKITSTEKFIQHIEANDIVYFMYAAIKKYNGNGNSQYANALKPFLTKKLIECSYPDSYEFDCLLYMYLDGSFTLNEQYQKLVDSFDTLYPGVGIDGFILTSPNYYGVRAHPDFDSAANAFLDRTYRQWNPHLVAERE